LTPDLATAAPEPWLSWPAPLADWSGLDGAAGTGIFELGETETTWSSLAYSTLESDSGPSVIDGNAVGDGPMDAAISVPSEVPTESCSSLTERATDSFILAWAQTNSFGGALPPDSPDATAQPEVGTIAVWTTSYAASIDAEVAGAACSPAAPSGAWVSTVAHHPGLPIARPLVGVDSGPSTQAANPAPATDPPILAHSAQSNAVEHSA
jgi:hypothetical protein